MTLDPPVWPLTKNYLYSIYKRIKPGPFVLSSYAVANAPDATLYTGGLIYVTDETGGAVPAFSDGTNWRRVTDRAVVS